MVSTLGQIEKLFNKASKTKKSRRRKSAPQKFQLESKTAKTLSKLGLEGDTFTRAELMQGISAYIRNKNLQNPDKKTVWLADSTISKVLGVSKGSENTYLSINQLITPIVKASTKVATESSWLLHKTISIQDQMWYAVADEGAWPVSTCRCYRWKNLLVKEGISFFYYQTNTREKTRNDSDELTLS